MKIAQVPLKELLDLIECVAGVCLHINKERATPGNSWKLHQSFLVLTKNNNAIELISHWSRDSAEGMRLISRTVILLLLVFEVLIFLSVSLRYFLLR